MRELHAPVYSAMLLALALGCGLPPAPAPVDCVPALRGSTGMDASGAPEVCEELTRAIEPFGPVARGALDGWRVVRAGRGPCGDRCPDLASALLSDGALAWVRPVHRELHLPDAYFEGSRWRGGPVTDASLDTLLAGLGIGWYELVTRVQRLPGASLPADPPPGDPRVLDAVVRAGPEVMLGGPVDRVDLLRHELAHAVLLASPGDIDRVARWSSLSDWVDEEGERADGFVGGFRSSERPIVAVRLVLGLDRGAGDYLPRGTGLPTRYAAFDPVEDHAESMRLLYADPAALGAVAPDKLLVLSADGVPLGAELRQFIEPGVARLLGGSADPVLAMETLARHGAALLPEAIPHANPTPLPVPADLHDALKPLVGGLRVEIAGHAFRPPDVAVARQIAAWETRRRMIEELDASIEALRGDW